MLCRRGQILSLILCSNAALCDTGALDGAERSRGNERGGRSHGRGDELPRKEDRRIAASQPIDPHHDGGAAIGSPGTGYRVGHLC